MNRNWPFLLLTLLPMYTALGQTPASPQPVTISREEQNKAIARRVFDEILTQGKFQVADEIYARDFVNHGQHRNASLAEDQAAARWEKTLLPDLTMTIDLITANQDYVTVVWSLRGTNTGHSGWFPATGVHIEERGITVWRIVDARLHDEWTSFDTLRIIRQILYQLKWLLLGFLCGVVILLWLLGQLIRKLWRVRRPAMTAA